jgi:hypothetical protein
MIWVLRASQSIFKCIKEAHLTWQDKRKACSSLLPTVKAGEKSANLYLCTKNMSNGKSMHKTKDLSPTTWILVFFKSMVDNREAGFKSPRPLDVVPYSHSSARLRGMRVNTSGKTRTGPKLCFFALSTTCCNGTPESLCGGSSHVRRAVNSDTTVTLSVVRAVWVSTAENLGEWLF